MRLCVVLLISLLLNVEAMAQRLERSRLRAASPTFELNLAPIGPQPSLPQHRRPTLRVTHQLFAAFAGMAVGATIGALVGKTQAADHDDGYTAAAFGIPGGVVGAAVGVQWYGHSKGYSAPFALTLLGSTVGLIGGDALLITVPLGATWAYSMGARAREASP